MKIKKFSIYLLFSSVVVFGLYSCEKESSVTTEENLDSDSIVETSNTNLLLKDISLLVGKVLQDTKVRNQVDADISEVDKYREIVSFSYLLGNEKGINKNESKILKSGSKVLKSGQNTFSDAISKELFENLSNYKTIANTLENRNINFAASKSGEDLPQDLSDFFASHNIEIYLPYDETGVSSKDGDNFYVTYRPEEYVEENEVFEYSGNDSKSVELKSIGFVDNDFVDSHKVYVVGVMDNCDTNYARCDYVDLDPISGGGGPDPLPNGGAKLIDYNVDHTSIEEKDILTTRFAGFKVKGNDWLGFGATHQKLDIYRGATDGKVTVDTNGNIKAESKSYNIMYHRIRAKGARKGWWYDVDIDEEFDNDWNLSETEQAILVFTKHHLKAEASLSFKAKLKFDKSFSPTFEGEAGVEGKVTVGAAKQRTKAQLSRRQVLSTVVGEFPSGETRESNGVNYNVKKSSIFHYYFKHYVTDL